MKSIGVDELEKLLLREIKSVKGCETIELVTAIPRAQGDWICGPMKLGRCDSARARTVATEIESRLRRMYALKA